MRIIRSAVAALGLAGVLAGCATPQPRAIDPTAPVTILVVDAQGLAAFAAEARTRPDAPVQSFSANFHFVANPEPAWCAFLAAWRAANPPPRQSLLGAGAESRARSEAYTAAREAAGVTIPANISFRAGAGEHALPGGPEGLENWAFLVARQSRVPLAPGEAVTFTSASLSGYARIALTSAEGRSVSFAPGSPLSFARTEAPITLVGPFRLALDGDTVALIHVPSEEDAIQAEAARVTGRAVDAVAFAPLGATPAARCPP